MLRDLKIKTLLSGSLISFAALLAPAADVPGPETNGIPLVTSADIAGNGYNNRLIRFEGTVCDAFRDELDPDYLFALAEDGSGKAYLSFKTHQNPVRTTHELIGCRITAIGFCRPYKNPRGSRRLGHQINLPTNGLIRIVTRPVHTPFDARTLDTTLSIPPSELQAIGRRKSTGLVVARRHPNEFLLRNEDDTISRVELQEPSPPAIGDFVEVVGNVETDIHNLNFSRALWRKAPAKELPAESAPTLTARQVLFNKAGQPFVQIRLHGHPVRIEGIIRSLPDPEFSDRVLFAESGGITFPIDASNCPEVFGKLAIGTKIEATGVCWMDIDNWRPNSAFPKVKGFTLVLRTPNDVAIIARPPWWTPIRLFAVSGVLLAVLLGFGIWNRALRKVAERRGRQLFREQATRMEAELRSAERSRLAVELHDSISQVLTGVALKIKAAQAQARTDLDKALNNLNIAENTLRSSREELRYCLWDLRNNILDLPNLEEAIRQTLKPQTGEIGLTVRFPVPRRRLSDNTIHIILQIVRELSVNAIRHGNATAIRIAGSLDRNVLAFSVQDNGIGFDPATAPGPEQGHFGLLGVQDRLAHYSGTIDIESSPGKGTKAVVRMTVVADGEDTAS